MLQTKKNTNKIHSAPEISIDPRQRAIFLPRDISGPALKGLIRNDSFLACQSSPQILILPLPIPDIDVLHPAWEWGMQIVGMYSNLLECELYVLLFAEPRQKHFDQ